jgi:hypothetical protein
MQMFNESSSIVHIKVQNSNDFPLAASASSGDDCVKSESISVSTFKSLPCCQTYVESREGEEQPGKIVDELTPHWNFMVPGAASAGAGFSVVYCDVQRETYICG